MYGFQTECTLNYSTRIYLNKRGNNTLEKLSEHYHAKDEFSQIFSVGQRNCLKLANLYPFLLNDFLILWNDVF